MYMLFLILVDEDNFGEFFTIQIGNLNRVTAHKGRVFRLLKCVYGQNPHSRVCINIFTLKM